MLFCRGDASTLLSNVALYRVVMNSLQAHRVWENLGIQDLGNINPFVLIPCQVPIHSNQGSDLGSGRSSWIRSLSFYRVLLFLGSLLGTKLRSHPKRSESLMFFQEGPPSFTLGF